MNALELAQQLEIVDWKSTQYEAAAMLRKQHEAIKTLREDLAALLNDYDAQNISDAKQTLKDTEEIAK